MLDPSQNLIDGIKLSPCAFSLFDQVVIDRKSASVYDDLPEREEKPSVGQGLNKPTTVTLFRVFPKGDNLSDEEKRQYEDKVRKRTAGLGEKVLPGFLSGLVS